MNDRVRIYELAKQMNKPAQVVIDDLRELGYDIKSHSSTVDKAAVGLLIHHQTKKEKEQKPQDKAAKPAKSSSSSSTSTSKTLPKSPPPPPAPVVKPRVLNRYRREPLVPVESTPENGQQPAAAQSVLVPILPQETAAPPAVQQPAAETKAPETPAAAATTQTMEPSAAAVEEVVAVETPVVAEPEPIAPIETLPEPEIKVEVKPEPEEEEPAPAHGVAIRPMTPSVPVRVAAPSVRATPPRPPKTHRQSPSDRHQKKDDRSRPTPVPVIEAPKILTLTGPLTVKDLSEKMNVSETEVIKRLFMRGFPRTVNQLVEYELAKDLAVEMEYEILTEDEALPEEEEKKVLTEEEKAFLVLRPPVVTIMGHVDHGKTSLLDAIRQTKFLLTDSEAGGITQHIGAYHVEVEDEDGSMRQVVFLDTPGHEAFTAMRARGAKATDIAILVVAADDGVMPQTIEAIDHAKAAGVPIIVAVNKIDKQDSDPDRVLTQLMEHDLLPDKFGGETVTVNVSAKKRIGLDNLLEMILLVADILDLRANPELPA